jgi:hypothetical protein
MKYFFLKNNYFLLLILSLASILSFIILNQCLNTEELLYNSLVDVMSADKVNDTIEVKEKWNWLSYLISPLIILIRTSLVALCLSVGLFFYNTENNIKFKQFFKIALLGEFILASVGFIKFIYFYLIKTDFTLEDLQQFYPLSYTNYLDLKNIEPWLVYPLQTINLFEIAYFLVLVYGLHKLLKNKYSKSFEIVAVSYGSGLVIWLGLVMFLTLNIS